MNAAFGRPALNGEDAHASPDGFKLGDILRVEDERKVGNGYIVRFHARLFQILPGAKAKPGPGVPQSSGQNLITPQQSSGKTSRYG
ncbi:MAG: hypothetical protein LBL45_11315 [Treponema sp.]|jgi:hypothetical protein|nr:hypothetical protein [Treponema sp.]